MTIPAGLNAACMSNRLLAYDDFSEADNTLLLNKSLDVGATWSKEVLASVANSSVCSGGVAKQAALARYTWIVTECGYGDVELTANIVITASDYNGFIVRSNNVAYGAGANFVYVGTRSNLSVIRTIVNTTDTTITSSATSHTVGTVYPVSLKVSGTSIIYTTPLVTLSGTLPSNTGYTKHGIMVYSSGTTYGSIDNFKVEAL